MVHTLINLNTYIKMKPYFPTSLHHEWTAGTIYLNVWKYLFIIIIFITFFCCLLFKGKNQKINEQLFAAITEIHITLKNRLYILPIQNANFISKYLITMMIIEWWASLFFLYRQIILSLCIVCVRYILQTLHTLCLQLTVTFLL